jgi:hypothetical protein
MLRNLLDWLNDAKIYSRITGGILFLVGLLGFAFRNGNSLPDVYLIAALILGFWGIVVSFTL